MVKKLFVTLWAVGLLVLAGTGATAQSEKAAPADNPATDQTEVGPEGVTNRVIVTYFHGDVRCATCKKLEAYAKNAIESGFASELADSSLVWRTVNYDEDENQHYIDDYKLFTKSLIISRSVKGAEVGWRNLDKIWELVNDEGKYTAYVQDEIRKFMADDGPDE